MEKEELIRKFGTAGMNYYIHSECVNTFTKDLPKEDKVFEAVWFLKPEELIGKYNDIHQCDSCGKEFVLSDFAYLGIKLTSLNELTILIKTRSEKK